MKKRPWHWGVRKWLLQPVIEMMWEDRSMAKDAAAELEALLDQQDKALEALGADIAADEETDYEKLRPLLARVGANNTKITNMGGVAPNGIDNSLPVDARSGVQLGPDGTVVTSDTGPVIEPDVNAGSTDPGSQDNASSDNSSS